MNSKSPFHPLRTQHGTLTSKHSCVYVVFILVNRNCPQTAPMLFSHHNAREYTTVAFRITAITAKAWLLDALHSPLD